MHYILNDFDFYLYYVEGKEKDNVVAPYLSSTDCPKKNYNRTFSITNFQNCKSIWICFICILAKTPSDLVQ